MRILVDGRCFQTPHATGVSVYAKCFLRHLFARNTEDEYVVWYNGVKKTDVPVWDYPNVSVVWTRWPNKLLHASLVLLRYPRLDLFVAWAFPKEQKFHSFFSLNFHAVVLSPWVSHSLVVHDLSFEHIPECYTYWQRIRQMVLRPRAQCLRATCIVTPSEHTKQDIIRTYGFDEPRRILVIPPVVDPYPERDSDVQKISKHYILCLGTLEPRKNIQSVLDAYVAAGMATRNIVLIIVGSSGWKSRALRRRIQQTQGVVYFGYMPERMKWDFYRHALVCVYPSLYEGYGLPVAEALSVGTPVITSNRTSLLELHDPKLVTFVNPDNVGELTMALEHYNT